MTATSIIEILGVVSAKITDITNHLTEANKGLVDQHSDHTYYGVPEAVNDDLFQAIDLLVLSLNKIKTITNTEN